MIIQFGGQCKNGHERTPESLYPSGGCRPCNRAAVDRYRAKRAAA